MKRVLLLLAVACTAGAAWLGWQRYAPPAPPLTVEADRVDHILIEKSARRLTASKDGLPVMVADVALGFAPEGGKAQEGDGKTPEGVFRIGRRNPRSAFHLSLGIDYPQAEDIARAGAAGVSPGGDIFIHGQPNSLGDLVTLPGDWTEGCIAITNDDMRRLWQLAGIGTVVEIRP